MSSTDDKSLRSIRPNEHRPRSAEPTGREPPAHQPLVAPTRKFQFAAIDRGFGLDADVMIERSQRLHAHHRGKVPPSEQHVVLNASGSPTMGGLSKSTSTQGPTATSALSHIAKQHSDQPQLSQQQQQSRMAPALVQPEPSQKFVSPIQPIHHTQTHSPANNLHFQPLPQTVEMVSAASSTKVTGARAFCAFVADLCIPVSILVSFLVTAGTWQPGLEQALAKLAMRSQTWGLVESTYLLFPWLFALGATCTLTFITQYFCGMLGHNSFGRSLCAMNLKKINSITHIFLLALFEAITFGGLLTLPLLFLIPHRLPLFPWVQFRLRS